MKPDMRLTKTKQAEFRAEARRLIADYMYSEGCSCCQSIGEHSAAKDALGKLFHVAKYADGSGYDWFSYRTQE